jgi:TetR/AcrR family transcriptional regulator, tetracycline repressor protein
VSAAMNPGRAAPNIVHAIPGEQFVMTKQARPVERDRLNREAIVTNAITLADAEGLDAVTIRRLARDQAVTPMALYWHFRDKERLFCGIAERLFDSVILPAPAGDWVDQLRDLLHAFLGAIRPHAPVAGLVLGRALASEAGLNLAEHLLGVLRSAVFPPEQASDVGSYLLSAITTLVTTQPGPARVWEPETRDAAIRTKRANLSSLDPRRFPNVIVSADALASRASEESHYSLGVELLVQGVRGIQPT